MLALGIDQEIDDPHRGFEQHLARPLAGAFLFQLAQDRQRQTVIRAHQSGAVAMRAGLGRGLDHAGAQALARHLQQPKARDAPDLDAGAVGFQLVLQALFHSRVVAAFFHVDKVDHDQPGQIAQAQLACHFFGRLEIGLERGFLDRAFLGGAARVHIDRHQRLGRVDHDIAAGFQLHGRVEHARQIAFDLMAGEKRHRVGVMFHIARMRGHDHFHEVLGSPIACLALDQNFVDLAIVKVADRPLDQVAFFIDLGRRDRLERELADLFPQAQKVFVIALDFGLGALGARRAHDQPGALRHLNFGCDRLELLAVGGIGDLAADAAATGGVGHEHAIAAGQAEIGGQRRALVAALFLDDLHQKNLAHLDNLLNLVFFRPAAARCADLFDHVFVGDVLDLFVLFRGVQRGFFGLVDFLDFDICNLGFDLGGLFAGFLDRGFGHRFHRRQALVRLDHGFGLKVDHIHPGNAAVGLAGGNRIIRAGRLRLGTRPRARTRPGA